MATQMPGLPASCVQVVDENREFHADLQARIDVLGLEAGYHSVSVLGSQSSGKSTMLNHVFGTNFVVMDEMERRQTTRGILASRARDMNLMVMDVEGTDGGQQLGETGFDRKSTLFSLAISEVLVINIWENQVGLYGGGNMGLLETVLEANLTLFEATDQAPHRTMLLFVIRDHTGRTPLASLQDTITRAMNRSWANLRRPANLALRQLGDFFDLKVMSLPHMIYRPDEFHLGITQLRNQFSTHPGGDYIFKPEYDRLVPPGGIARYMSGIWERVEANITINLPELRMLHAQYYCNSYAGVALEELKEQTRAFPVPREDDRVVDGLGRMMRTWYDAALGRFDTSASGYHQPVYQAKRQDLIAELKATLAPLFREQLRCLYLQALATFERNLLRTLIAIFHAAFPTPRLERVAELRLVTDIIRERTRARQYFQDMATEAMGTPKLAEGTEEGLDGDWSFERELRLVESGTQRILRIYCYKMAGLGITTALFLGLCFAIPVPPLAHPASASAVLALLVRKGLFRF